MPDRVRGRIPRILFLLTAFVAGIIGYAAAGLAGWVPWRTGVGSTVASGVWLGLAGIVLLLGTRRIHAAEYATSRRNGYRIAARTAITVDGVAGELIDISIGGAAARFPAGSLPETGLVEFELPGAAAIKMSMARIRHSATHEVASLQADRGDWAALRAMSLWLFHTPAGAIPSLPPGLPAIATRETA